MTSEWIRKPIGIKRAGQGYPSETLGLEIEVEGQNLPRTIFRDWCIHDDGSLRGVDNAEYVLRTPLTRTNLESALRYLDGKFNESGAIIDTESDRTSVHVHYNVQDWTWVDVVTFWTVWTIVEDLSFELCGTERRGNLFCLRLKDCEGLVLGTRDAFEGGLPPWRGEDTRYAALNLNSVNKFGSIEFRGMHGTVDQTEILRWVDFILACIKKAKRFDNPHDVVKGFSQDGPDGFLRSLELNKATLDVLKANRNHSSMLWEGMRLAQDVAWILNDWGKKEVKPESVLDSVTITTTHNVGLNPAPEWLMIDEDVLRARDEAEANHNLRLRNALDLIEQQARNQVVEPRPGGIRGQVRARRQRDG